MKKRRNQAGNRHSLQVVTLCISTAMVLVLIGIVVLTVFTGRNLSRYVKENLTVTMILQPDLSNSECAAICRKVEQHDYITQVSYTSKEQALKEGTKELGANPAEFAGENPFTAEIELKLKASYANNDSIRRIAKDLRQFKGVSEVTYRQDLVNSVNKMLSKVSIVLLIIASLLTVVSFSLINNTIRLSVYARRFAIHTMKLVGASWNFIRLPFLRQAVGLGLLSAAIALVVLGVGMFALYGYEPEMTTIIDWEVMTLTAVIVLAVGVVLTTFCAWLSVNKFLRMKAGDLYKI